MLIYLNEILCIWVVRLLKYTLTKNNKNLLLVFQCSMKNSAYNMKLRGRKHITEINMKHKISIINFKTFKSKPIYNSLSFHHKHQSNNGSLRAFYRGHFAMASSPWNTSDGPLGSDRHGSAQLGADQIKSFNAITSPCHYLPYPELPHTGRHARQTIQHLIPHPQVTRY